MTFEDQLIWFELFFRIHTRWAAVLWTRSLMQDRVDAQWMLDATRPGVVQ